jgi:RNA polymerase sigma factor (TIGR02999 family)
MTDLTHILVEIESGDSSAAEKLLPLVYDELRKLAQARMAGERPDHTLQATALVHEAYLRLVAPSQVQHWQSRGHFFASAAMAMRRILVEAARRKHRSKHGGKMERFMLADHEAPTEDSGLIGLDDALTMLAAEDPQAAKVVELRYFAGLGHEDIAAALDITVYRARQKWTYARAWLKDFLANS